MFLLSNDQRACLGLTPVEPGWEWVQLKSSPYDGDEETWACFSGKTIRKAVTAGTLCYLEADFCEETAEDRTLILPRTKRGKPKKLSAVTLMERKPLGMSLSWQGKYGALVLGCADTQRTYYSARPAGERIDTFAQFTNWLDRWTAETTDADRAEAAAFSRASRKHVRFREGDFFRFSVGRREYGYGRILLDVDRMRKSGEPMWDIVMGKPLVIKIYHLITKDPDVPPEHLRHLPALPSQYVMDNALYYGDWPIIGHMPLDEAELDFPIMYGGSISMADAGKGKVLLQNGRLFRELKGQAVLSGCGGFRHNGVGFGSHVDRENWEACIAAGSNAPLWARSNELYYLRSDLRNPQHRRELEAVCRQFGMTVGQLHIQS